MTTAKGGSGPARWSARLVRRLRVIRSAVNYYYSYNDVQRQLTEAARAHAVTPSELRLYTQAYK